jgi:hypothetical protein
MKIIYFLGGNGNPNKKFSGSNYIYLDDVSNDYRSASYKQFLGLKYIHDNYKTKFVLCCGTDTYINIKKLDLLIRSYNPEENLYIGGWGCYRQIHPDTEKLYFHSGGPGFILSKTCLQKIYPRLESILEEWLTICNKNNIELHDACDVCISYFLQLPEINVEVIKLPGNTFTNSAYHWENIIIKDIISCHNMCLNDFDDFTNILDCNNYFM